MFRSRLLTIALAGALFSAPAWAQDDDDLAPLTPRKKVDGKPKPKPKVAPRPMVKPKPAPVTTTPPITPADDDLAPLAPVKADLVIKLAASSLARHAKVTIDDREVGTLPLPPQSINTGEHTVVVRAPGFAPFTRKVTIVGTRANELSVALEATAALLSVTADVPGSEVLINGRSVGTAPRV